MKKFFNTSGQIYKTLGLAKKLPAMTEEEQLDLLASDGMLVKRPILVGENKVLVGFKEEGWERELENKEARLCLALGVSLVCSLIAEA